MITTIKNKKTEIDFSKPQLLKMKNSEVVLITNGKTTKNEDGLFIEGTIVNGDTTSYIPGEFNSTWRSDIWEKFKGSVTIHSSDND